jgi:hypothetical protein
VIQRKNLQDLAAWSDGMGEMHLTRLDPETARRLVDGCVAPDDAPPGYAGVAELLAAASGAASDSDRVGNDREEDTVSAMQAIVLEHLDTPTIAPRRRHMRKKVLAAKTAAATTAVLLGAGAAAAATGTLPASSVLSKIGISVPGNNGHANSGGQSTAAGNNGTKGTHSDTVNNNRQGHGPPAAAAAGLCRAKIASDNHPNANSEVSHFVCPGNVTPAGGGAQTNSGSDQPSGPPSSTPVGPPSSTPPVNTPNHGDAGSSASTNISTGLSTAGGHDGGASSTGSGAATAGGGNAVSHP